jgi:hypothetical protein
VDVNEMNRHLGYTQRQREQYEAGFYSGFTGKVYCDHPDCQGWYLPHEH